MVMIGEDGAIHVWDIASCDAMVTHNGHEDAVLGIAYSPCGKLLASCSHDNTVRVWNTNTRLVCICRNLHGYHGVIPANQ